MRDARLQLHWAAQIPAGVGRTLNPPRADDSHTSFTWSPSHGALMQEPVNGTSAGLRLRDLTLVISRGDDVVGELSLRGRTLDHGFAFLEGHYRASLKRPEVDLPAHPVAQGARFDGKEHELSALAKHYAVAAAICEEVKASDPGAGAVRCWPHHFDIATLIDRGDSKTLGVGLSPGDIWYDEPYWYVTAWPYPEETQLGELHAGQWHTQGWIGAVLRPGEPDQQELIRPFIEEARARLSST